LRDKRGDEGAYRWLHKERSTLFNGGFREKIADEIGVIKKVSVLYFKESVDNVGNLFAGFRGEYFFELLLLEDERVFQT